MVRTIQHIQRIAAFCILLSSGSAFGATPTAEELARWIFKPTPQNLAQAVTLFRAAEDPSKNPEALKALTTHFNPGYEPDGIMLVDTELRTALIEGQRFLNAEDWLTLVRGWVRNAHSSLLLTGRLDLIGELATFEISTPYATLKYKKPLIQMIESEIRSGKLHPTQHRDLILRRSNRYSPLPDLSIVDQFEATQSPILGIRPKVTPETASLRRVLSITSEESFELGKRILFRPNVIHDRLLDDALKLLTQSSSPLRRREALDALFESGVLNTIVSRELKRYDLNLFPQSESSLRKIFNAAESAPFNTIDILNSAIKRDPHSLEWVMPAFFLKQTGYPHNKNVQTDIRALEVRRPDYQRALSRIDLSPVDPKILEAALLYLPLSEFLPALTNPTSPYFDRADLFAQYMRGDFYKSTHVDRADYPTDIPTLLQGAEHRDGVPLPPRLAKWVGQSHLTIASWESVLGRESLAPLEGSPEGRAKLNALFKDPRELKRAMLSRDMFLRKYAFEHARTRTDLLEDGPALLEEVILSIIANDIAAEGNPNTRAEYIAMNLKPLFDGDSFWKNHPEFLEPGTKGVTPHQIAEHILSKKRSFVLPAEPQAAPAHCLRQFLNHTN